MRFYFLPFMMNFPAGSKGQILITNWGPAAFSNAELTHREKQWQKEKMHAQLGSGSLQHEENR